MDRAPVLPVIARHVEFRGPAICTEPGTDRMTFAQNMYEFIIAQTIFISHTRKVHSKAPLAQRRFLSAAALALC